MLERDHLTQESAQTVHLKKRDRTGAVPLQLVLFNGGSNGGQQFFVGGGSGRGLLRGAMRDPLLIQRQLNGLPNAILLHAAPPVGPQQIWPTICPPPNFFDYTFRLPSDRRNY